MLGASHFSSLDLASPSVHVATARPQTVGPSISEACGFAVEMGWFRRWVVVIFWMEAEEALRPAVSEITHAMISRADHVCRAQKEASDCEGCNI